MNLSPNFTLAEFCASETALRHGIPNVPPQELMPNLRIVAGHLETIRAAMDHPGPIVISSGYRCQHLNRQVGGAPTSAHVHGLAADIKAPQFYGGNVKKLCQFIAGLQGVPFDQLIYEYGPSGWCHIGFAMGTPRREILSKPNSASAYLKGIIDIPA